MSEAPASWRTFKDAVRALEDLLATAERMSLEDRQKQLLLMLSRLEIACLELPDLGADDVDGVRPNTHYERRAVIEKAFPELGLYQSVRPFNPDNPQDTVVGDTVDDLAEILGDIDSALWAEAKEGWRNGIWEARFGYEHHFGAHLVDLRSFLYHLRFFGP